MRRWFLSYNSQDVELARRLVAAIAQKDAQAEVFFAPQSLRPGAYWMPALEKEIAEATAFLLLVGKNGLGPWQALEYQEAIDRSRKEPGFAVVPLVLDRIPAPGLPFLRQLHWIINADPASEKSVAQLFDAASGVGAAPAELWRHAAPYRGLSAMTETDADFFFGRERETAEAIGALAATADKLPLLLGNSGVGKSSLAQAGVVAALMRQDWLQTNPTADPWPQIFHESRRWCFLRLKPGAEPLRALVDPFLWTWQFEAVDPRRAELQANWAQKLLDGGVGLRDLVDATQARYRDELHQPEPPAFLLYIDQGEELYVKQAGERERRRFSEILAQGLPDPRLRVMMSMRADFFGELQKDEALYAVHRIVNVPPLREVQLREVVSNPADLLSAQFETPQMVDIITRRTAEDLVRDVGALPLLSYTLDDMWTQMVARGDATLRLPAQSFDLSGVLIERANTFLVTHPGAEAALRRVLTLRLATVREDGEPTRRRAARSEFSDEEWRLVSELADQPNRLLVTATTDTGETYAEVAHEAIFRRWDRLREWIAAEREFLAWRNSLEMARRSWQSTPERSRHDALLMGFALAQAQSWLAKGSEDISETDRAFIMQSRKAARRRTLRMQTMVGVFAALIVAGVAAWWQQDWLKERMYMLVHGTVLSAAQEGALEAKDLFKECADCPEMIVVPAGSFLMGSPFELGENREHPQHNVTIARPFAVSKFEVTFNEWDFCVAQGACTPRHGDVGWGRGDRPAINVDWEDAKSYVAWLSKITRKDYRLLSEAEYEYAIRAGTYTEFPWGDAIGDNNANCDGCNSRWSKQTAPVGSFAPNAFGLFDMVGNVLEWVEDCYHDNYDDAPNNGSAWIDTGLCKHNVMRGGGWGDTPKSIRSAYRESMVPEFRNFDLGFRVARTLAP